MPTPVHRALAALALAASFVTPSGALPLVLQATSQPACALASRPVSTTA